MNAFFRLARAVRSMISVALAVLIAMSPSAAVLAQTNAAQQAVRQRVEGLGREELPAATLEGPSAAELPSVPGAPPVGTEGGIDARFVAPGASAVIAIRPAQIMASPLTEMLPREVATAAGLTYLGVDPANVDQVVAFGDLSNPMMPGYGVMFKFNQPFRATSIPPSAYVHAQLSELNGKKYLQSHHPILPSFYGSNKATLVLAPDGTLRQLVEAGGQAASGPLLDHVRQAPAGSDLYVAVDVAALRPIAGPYVGMAASKLPPDLQPLFTIPNFISAAELTVNLTGDGPTSLVVHANDEAAAEQVLSLVADANRKYQEGVKARLAEQAASQDPIERAYAQYAERVSGNWMTQFMPVRDGAKLTLFHSDGLDESQKKMLVAGSAIAAGALLPAVQAARQAGQRTASMTNMKQIMLALLNHESAKRSLPAHAIYSEDGTPLLSWRVQILPYIDGGQQLYEQFKLDEPWDSEHNKALIAQMPTVYANPDVNLGPGKTHYLAVVGNDCVFNGTKDGIQLKDITDGTSNTIAVVEADPAQAVEWTRPDDLKFNPDDPKAGLGNVRAGGWNAALCDGSVRFIADGIDPQVVKALITRAGGEATDPSAP